MSDGCQIKTLAALREGSGNIVNRNFFRDIAQRVENEERLSFGIADVNAFRLLTELEECRGWIVDSKFGQLDLEKWQTDRDLDMGRLRQRFFGGGGNKVIYD